MANLSGKRLYWKKNGMVEKSLCKMGRAMTTGAVRARPWSPQCCTPLGVISVSLLALCADSKFKVSASNWCNLGPMPWLLPSYQRVVTRTWAKLSFQTAKWTLFPWQVRQLFLGELTVFWAQLYNLISGKLYSKGHTQKYANCFSTYWKLLNIFIVSFNSHFRCVRVYSVMPDCLQSHRLQLPTLRTKCYLLTQRYNHSI